MNPQGLADELNQLLAIETRSLSRHLDEARPHLTPKTYRAWNKIRNFGHVSVEHAQRISGLLSELNLPFRTVPHPMDVARFHYLELGYLLPLLIEEKQRAIAAYERALMHGDDEPLVVEVLSDLLEQNREQLGRLQSVLPEIVGGNPSSQGPIASSV